MIIGMIFSSDIYFSVYFYSILILGSIETKNTGIQFMKRINKMYLVVVSINTFSIFFKTCF